MPTGNGHVVTLSCPSDEVVARCLSALGVSRMVWGNVSGHLGCLSAHGIGNITSLLNEAKALPPKWPAWKLFALVEKISVSSCCT